LFYYCAISLYIYSYPSVKGLLLPPGMWAHFICLPVSKCWSWLCISHYFASTIGTSCNKGYY